MPETSPGGAAEPVGGAALDDAAGEAAALEPPGAGAGRDVDGGEVAGGEEQAASVKPRRIPKRMSLSQASVVPGAYTTELTKGPRRESGVLR